ncbi:MAG TPA: pilus assembly protein TadG-related protein [Dongiaceae bacterium]|nr:pilus assembly protein TadG-related protein [Dongiaceae bacterium]
MSLRRVAAFWSCLTRPGGRKTAGGDRRFLLNERGSVAIYFGLSAIVFVGVAGLAVDAARGYLIKARLSEAIDAAALAGGKALQNDTDSNHTLVTNDVLAFFNANFPNGSMGANVAVPTITVDTNSTSVTVSSNARIPTTLMRLLGFNNMLMTASAQVARAATGLDVVLSFDNSGSMNDTISGDTQTKMQQQRQNAQDLVDLLAKPFTSGLQQQIITVQGQTYSLLNIGVVPWNSKVNVKTWNTGTQSVPSGSGTVTTGATYATDPMGRYPSGNGTSKDAQKGYTGQVYYSSLSKVPLLLDPSKIPGGWSGCVYARYNGDTTYDNDADLTLGATTVGGLSWPGWEPIANDEGDGNCYQSSWNDNKTVFDSTYFKFYRPSGWYSLPSSQRHDDSCAPCLSTSILPLTSSTTDVKNMIKKLSATSTTNAVQGLFWAWEVLMPGDPFNEAVVSPPFPRAQAIVLMTDGQSHGSNGDAYHGWFGEGDQSSSATSFGQMTMPGYNADCTPTTGTLVSNNLGNRLLALATKIKGCDVTKGGPGWGPVKLYVIQYQQAGEANLTTLLQAVATDKNPPYFFAASNGTELQKAFTAIGASLSALRLVK